MRNWTNGPGFLTWSRGQNSRGNGIAGALPRSFMKSQWALQKQILTRYRELGIAVRAVNTIHDWGSWFVAGWGSETTDSDPRASGTEAVGVAGSARQGSAWRSSSTLARRSPAAPPLLSDWPYYLI